jgi:hypothetical protein
MDSKPEKVDSVWREVQTIAPVSLAGEMVSDTRFKNMLSINISNAVMDLQGADAPLSSAWVGKFRVPLALAEVTTEVWYFNRLYFNIFKDAEAKATVVAILGDKTYPQDFDYGEALESIDFHPGYVHQALALPAQVYEVTLLVVAERRTTGNNITVSMEGLDVTVNPDLSKLPTIDKTVEQ